MLLLLTLTVRTDARGVEQAQLTKQMTIHVIIT